MRFLVSLLLVGALLFAALFVPIEGQNGWHRAHRDGWPRAAAATAAAAASASFRWAARMAEGIGQDARGLAGEGAQPGRKASPPAAPVRKRAMARAQAQRPPPPAQPFTSGQPAAQTQPMAAPARPTAPHDGIVAAPTKEQLDGADRHALDKLIAAHGGR